MKWLPILAILGVMLIGLPSLFGYLMRPPPRPLTEYDYCMKEATRIWEPCALECQTIECADRCGEPIEKCVDEMAERVNRTP